MPSFVEEVYPVVEHGGLLGRRQRHELPIIIGIALQGRLADVGEVERRTGLGLSGIVRAEIYPRPTSADRARVNRRPRDLTTLLFVIGLA